MGKNRDNCVILLVSPPEQEKTCPELKTSFGPERAAHVSSDLLSKAYRTIKNFNNAIPILSYEKTLHYPDLTWLDPEDPGFLEFKDNPPEERIREVFRLSFFTGAKKALLLDPLSPEVKEAWLSQAFEAINDRTVALGANQDGSFYLLGLTQQNLKIIDAPGFTSAKSAETLTERAKKSKLLLFNTPETYRVNSEDFLRKWLESLETAPQFFEDRPQPDASKQGQEPAHKKPHKRHLRSHEDPPIKPQQENP